MLEGAKTFLSRVVHWPTEGQDWWVNIHHTWKPPGAATPVLPGRAFKTLDQAANYLGWLITTGPTDIYVCMSGQSQAIPKVNKAGRPIFSAIRAKEFTVALRSLWLDIDVKAGAYGSTMDAMDALGAFIKAVELPKPTYVVLSGSGGFHVHWVTDDAMDPATWAPLAQALVNAAAAHKLKIDAAVTIDSARVLRVPDTFNWKGGTGSPVQLAYNGLSYDVQRLRLALGPFSAPLGHVGSQGHATPGSRAGAAPGLALPRRSPFPVPAYQLYIGEPLRFQFETLPPQCAWLKHVDDVQGADQTEPLWRSALVIAHYCNDSRDLAHDLSSAHPGYTEAATDQKFDQIEKTYAGDHYGWPQCRTIAGHGARECQTCPHLSKGKSPLNFATFPALPAPPVNGPLTSAFTFGGTTTPVQSVANNDLPSGWQRQAVTDLVYRMAKAPTDDDPNAQVPQYAAFLPILDLRAQMPKGGEGNGWIIVFRTRLNSTTTKDISINYRDMSDGRKLLDHLSAHGFWLRDECIKTFRSLMASFIEQLQNKLVLASENMGWSEEGGVETAFIYGRIRHNCAGNTPVAHTDIELDKLYAPTGQMAPWMAASKLVFDRKRPDLEAILAGGFAAPLVKLTGHQGLIVSAYSSRSGVGKTTALKIGASIWGHPSKTMLGLQIATVNALNKHLTSIQHLPGFFDELRVSLNGSSQFTELAFLLINGRGKSRLDKSANMQRVDDYSTMLIAASNNSLIDHIMDNTKTTVAGVLRVYEFLAELPDQGSLVNMGDAQVLLGSLASNYGHAGLAYAQFLGSNAPAVRKEVEEYSRRFTTELHATNEERFWISSMVTMRVGAKLANAIGIGRFDEHALIEFLVREFQRMRKMRASSPSDISLDSSLRQYVVDYLNDRQGHTVRSDVMRLGKGVVNYKSDPRSLRTPIRVHIAEDEKLLRISVTDFRSWLREQNVSERKTLLDRLTSQGMGKMLRSPTTLASGFRLSGAREWLMEFDLTKVDLID